MSRNLRYRADLDASGFEKGAKRVEKASANMTKKQSRSTRSMTQLAYAMDDAQYGFRGVQNNLQQLAVTMGASGPVIIGVTAMLLAIRYAIDHWEDFADAGQTAINKVADEFGKGQGPLGKMYVLTGLLQGATTEAEAAKYAIDQLGITDDQLGNLEEYQQYQVAIAKLKAIEVAMSQLVTDELKKQVMLRKPEKSFWEQMKVIWNDFIDNPLEALKGGETLNDMIDQQLDGSEDNMRTYLDTAKNMINELFAQFPKLNEYLKKDKSDKSGRPKKASFLVNPKDVDKAQKAIERYIEKIKDVGRSKEDVEFDKFQEDIAAIEFLFKQGIITLDEYLKRLENLSKAYDNVGESSKKGKDELSEADQILNAGLANMISGFAQAAGKGEDVGKALLGGIGNTLIQLGGMLVVTGIGVEAFKKSLQSLQGIPAIVAGTAMIAAGAAFASAANKAGGGTGRAAGTPSQSATGSSAPLTIEAGRITGSRGLRSSTTRGEDIRYNQQVAQDNYQGYS